MLVSHLNDSWVIVGRIQAKTVNFPGGRHATVYTVRLRRDNQTITMQVLSNPVVEKIVYVSRSKQPLRQL